MFNSKPTVKIISDSLAKNGKRLTTFEVTYWRPILPEYNTHRVFSRNTSSSRAKPFLKRVEEAVKQTFVPEHWNAEKPGMVGGEEFNDTVKTLINNRIQKLADFTANYLLALDEDVKAYTGYGIHKQYLNRYLEPFIGCTQLITSTEWDNWFKLRMASDAQPEIKDVACEMFYMLQENKPTILKEGQWHLPYISSAEMKQFDLDTLKRISVARCARISYKTYESGGVVEKDLELYNQLYKNGHMSPFEHIATPMSESNSYFNLKGWKSLRYDLEANS